MATKFIETRRFEESTERSVPRPEVLVASARLSDILKRKAVVRGISLATDAVALVSAHVTAKVLAQHFFRVPAEALNPRNYAAFYLPFLLAVLFVFERGQRLELRRPEKELELVAKGISLAFLLLVCANFVVFRSGFSRYMFVIWYLVTLLLLLTMRFGLRLSYGALWRRGIGTKRTLLVGSVRKLFELQTILSIQRYRGYELLGILPVGRNSHEEFQSNLPVFRSTQRWHDVVQQNCPEQVIVALDDMTPEGHELVSDILKRCLAKGIDVQVYSDLFASRDFNYELDGFSGFFRFLAAPPWSKQVQLATKRALDFAAGAVGSLITLAVLPFIALAIKLDDGGPVFYHRELLGPGGHPRQYRKFRTMRTNAEEALQRDPVLKAKFEEKHKLVNDPRVTRVGHFLRKYSIDEFPEFFMVLTGELSLVGPRAITRKEASRYGDRMPRLTSVKPGMTGFWQVMGRQLTSYEERMRMDMFYIDHWSIWLDLWIVIITAWKVIRAEGAF